MRIFLLFFFSGLVAWGANERYIVDAPVTIRVMKDKQNYLSVVTDLPLDSIISFDMRNEQGTMEYQNSSGAIVKSKNGWVKGVFIEKHSGNLDMSSWNKKELYLSLSHLGDIHRVGSHQGPPDKIPLKRFAKPKKMGKKHRLWGTYYHTPLYKVGGKHILHSMSDTELRYQKQKAALSHQQYCNSAMQGSVRITFKGGGSVTFNYAGTKDPALINCSKYYGNRYKRTANVRFQRARSKWGDGVAQYSLVPYRSIAVNPKKIPYGTVLYVPKARGTRIRLPGGGTFIHDGLFYASDTGGAMRADARHIDFFVGNINRRTFSLIKSTPKGKFDAFVVKDRDIVRRLAAIHDKTYH